MSEHVEIISEEDANFSKLCRRDRLTETQLRIMALAAWNFPIQFYKWKPNLVMVEKGAKSEGDLSFPKFVKTYGRGVVAERVKKKSHREREVYRISEAKTCPHCGEVLDE